MARPAGKLPLFVGLVVLALVGGREFLDAPVPATHQAPASAAASNAAERSTAIRSAVDAAFEQRRSDVQVAGTGEVVRVLPDDVHGSRHQRFVLRLASGRTVLVAHNIDLAPRVDGLALGDQVEFNGEYAWNDKGGVVHWTHHDPRGTHAPGWLRHGGQTYE